MRNLKIVRNSIKLSPWPGPDLKPGSLGINLIGANFVVIFVFSLGFTATDDEVKWVNGRTYFRLDGSTPSHERDRLINAFNKAPAIQIPLFLISTRAGSLGINLVGKIFILFFVLNL